MIGTAAALLALSMSARAPQVVHRSGSDRVASWNKHSTRDSTRNGASAARRSPTEGPPPGGYRVPLPTDSSAVAVRAATPPEIDGLENDPVWRKTPPITAFTEWQPNEGEEPRFRTVARIAYDASNLYVFVRAYDPHPNRIAQLLERRDSDPPTDKIWIWVDSYHDRLTGYEFGVNPAGVKEDIRVTNDSDEDQAWDAQWDVATRVDSLGWTAEYRIPLSQLRYGTRADHTFGIGIDRDIYRYRERVTWPAVSDAVPGLMSQLGTLSGLDGLEAPRRLEATPYVLAQDASRISDNRYTAESSVTAGGDVKYRLASNLTLNATLNPDFGQVEADPAVLNLSAVETFYDEHRPFFVAGAGLFKFRVNCSSVNCGPEGLYYSRRIGRTPELAGIYGDTVPPQPTRILGAAKLLGRFHNGLTLGVLDATTQRSTGPGGRTFEPTTNYGAVRVTQDLRNGDTTLGAMLTAVNRKNDPWTSPYLASDAYAGGIDLRYRFLDDTYQVMASLDGSRVAGSPDAILRVQRDAVHYFQRPDAGLPLDSAATVLRGDAEELRLKKVGGKHLLFETAYERRSAGFEINDLGFLKRADQASWNTWIGLFDRRETALYKRFQFNNNWWEYWSTGGLLQERAYNMNAHLQARNDWSWNWGFTLGHLGATYDDRAARGGPAVRQDPVFEPWIFISGNDRRAVVPKLNVNYNRGSSGRDQRWDLTPELDLKVSGNFSSSLKIHWSHQVNDHQWYGNFQDGAGSTHYTFAHLDQVTTSATVRLNYTFTPTVSLQAYLQPFVSRGRYSDVRQLSATPRAASYDARYAPYDDPSVTSDPGGFNFKEFNSNLVFRWEYKLGSTLFLVWNQGRQAYRSQEGTLGFRPNVNDLFRLHPANTFIVKVAYWLNR